MVYKIIFLIMDKQSTFLSCPRKIFRGLYYICIKVKLLTVVRHLHRVEVSLLWSCTPLNCQSFINWTVLYMLLITLLFLYSKHRLVKIMRLHYISIISPQFSSPSFFLFFCSLIFYFKDFKIICNYNLQLKSNTI